MHPATPTEDRPYVLGLDLGVQAVGWAVLDLDATGEPCGIRRAGVRRFDSGSGNPQDIEQGKEEPRNAECRRMRLQRRQHRRRAGRHATVFRLLQDAGFLPQGALNSRNERHRILVEMDRRLAAKFNEPGDRVAFHVLPYYLRAKALHEPLAPHALGRAFYHLAQRRGFWSNKKMSDTDERDEKKGEVKPAIAKLQGEIEASGKDTLGAFLSSIDPEAGSRIRDRWTGRRMFRREFDAIWDAQSPHHPALTPHLRKALCRAMFFQRPVKSQKRLVGKCRLEPRCRRARIAWLDFQRFRYLQKVNDVKVVHPTRENPALTDEERNILIRAMETTESLTFPKIRELLALDKRPKGYRTGYKINFEIDGDEELPGNRTGARLRSVLGGRWDAMPAEDRERLVQEILAFEREDALAKRLTKVFGFDDETASRVAAVNLEQGFCALSRHAIRKLLPHMENGVQKATAEKLVYGDTSGGRRPLTRLPPVLKRFPSLRNPVVCRALTELRTVVNALVREYGKPTMIRIELARDLKHSKKTRKKLHDRAKDNKREKDRARSQLRELPEMNGRDPTEPEILRFRLRKECNGECPYTGRQVEMRHLIGESPQFELEHIIPRRWLDDSYANKTLCYHEENRKKRNRTPFDCYSSNAANWNEIIARVKRFQGPVAAEKLRRFRMETVPDDFGGRQLVDTAYMSRLAAQYLGSLYGGDVDEQHSRRVCVVPGRATYHLRSEWQLDGVLKSPKLRDAIPFDQRGKNRFDLRHHAVDAVVVACSSARTIDELSNAAARADQRALPRFLADMDEPWPEFRDDVAHAIAGLKVSHRVERRIRGALHKENPISKLYRHVDESGKEYWCRHARIPLSALTSEKEIAGVVDDNVRDRVATKFRELRAQSSKPFGDEANHPYRETKDGRAVPIHRVRVRRAAETLTIGKGVRRRYVAPGSNHHMEILAVLDDHGQVKEWQGVLVSLFEASRRVRAHEPVIKRDHGPGKKFLFSLAGGEYVEMEHKPGQRQLFRVTVVSEKELEFRLHTDARPITVLKKIRGARVRRSPASLLEAKARKVAIDPLGNVLPAND